MMKWENVQMQGFPRVNLPKGSLEAQQPLWVTGWLGTTKCGAVGFSSDQKKKYGKVKHIASTAQLQVEQTGSWNPQERPQ